MKLAAMLLLHVVVTRGATLDYVCLGSGKVDWLVPAAVTQLTCTVSGAAGQSITSAIAGYGVTLVTSVPVTPGQLVQIYVGCSPSAAGAAGYPGGGTGSNAGIGEGGGGGGYSAVITPSYKIYAAGGGGAGGDGNVDCSDARGGNGGCSAGSMGFTGCTALYSAGGGGGSTSAGGVRGSTNNTVCTPTSSPTCLVPYRRSLKSSEESTNSSGIDKNVFERESPPLRQIHSPQEHRMLPAPSIYYGTAGSINQGGSGTTIYGGGGGGGGYYGGGGGALNGGGGGSSFTDVGVVLTSCTAGAITTGHGSVSITYIDPSANPTAFPSASPSSAPSAKPSAAPSAKPSASPSTSPSAKPTAVPTAAYKIIYNGKTYSLLSHAAPGSTAHNCQTGYLPLDAGYVIAPDDADSIAVIAAHGWDTEGVVVASGNVYLTTNYGTPGSYAGGGNLLTSGSTYKPGICIMQILQVCSTIFLFAFILM
jgi:hypothetical protein